MTPIIRQPQRLPDSEKDKPFWKKHPLLTAGLGVGALTGGGYLASKLLDKGVTSETINNAKPVDAPASSYTPPDKDYLSQLTSMRNDSGAEMSQYVRDGGDLRPADAVQGGLPSGVALPAIGVTGGALAAGAPGAFKKLTNWGASKLGKGPVFNIPANQSGLMRGIGVAGRIAAPVADAHIMGGHNHVADAIASQTGMSGRAASNTMTGLGALSGALSFAGPIGVAGSVAIPAVSELADRHLQWDAAKDAVKNNIANSQSMAFKHILDAVKNKDWATVQYFKQNFPELVHSKTLIPEAQRRVQEAYGAIPQ